MQQRTAGLIVSIALWCWLYPLHSNAQPSSSADTSGPATSGNGQHDFDFEEGRWNIHLKRLLHPLTGSTSWVEFDGTSVTRRVWDGKAWLEEFDSAHPVELVIANAGTSAGPDPDSPGEPVAMTLRQIEVNLVGTVNTIAPLVPPLCARGRGRVVAIASVAAFRGLPYSPGYCASKAGVRAYAEALRPRLARHGVGVTAVSPGFFSSPMTDRWDGPTPFLASGERAARRIKRGIDRGAARIDFPWPLVLGMRFCDLAPAAIGDAILRGFRFRIRDA